MPFLKSALSCFVPTRAQRPADARTHEHLQWGQDRPGPRDCNLFCRALPQAPDSLTLAPRTSIEAQAAYQQWGWPALQADAHGPVGWRDALGARTKSRQKVLEGDAPHITWPLFEHCSGCSYDMRQGVLVSLDDRDNSLTARVLTQPFNVVKCGAATPETRWVSFASIADRMAVSRAHQGLFIYKPDAPDTPIAVTAASPHEHASLMGLDDGRFLAMLRRDDTLFSTEVFDADGTLLARQARHPHAATTAHAFGDVVTISLDDNKSVILWDIRQQKTETICVHKRRGLKSTIDIVQQGLRRLKPAIALHIGDEMHAALRVLRSLDFGIGQEQVLDLRGPTMLTVEPKSQTYRIRDTRSLRVQHKPVEVQRMLQRLLAESSIDSVWGGQSAPLLMLAQLVGERHFVGIGEDRALIFDAQNGAVGFLSDPGQDMVAATPIDSAHVACLDNGGTLTIKHGPTCETRQSLTLRGFVDASLHALPGDRLVVVDEGQWSGTPHAAIVDLSMPAAAHSPGRIQAERPLARRQQRIYQQPYAAAPASSVVSNASIRQRSVPPLPQPAIERILAHLDDVDDFAVARSLNHDFFAAANTRQALLRQLQLHPIAEKIDVDTETLRTHLRRMLGARASLVNNTVTAQILDQKAPAHLAHFAPFADSLSVQEANGRVCVYTLDPERGASLRFEATTGLAQGLCYSARGAHLGLWSANGAYLTVTQLQNAEGNNDRTVQLRSLAAPPRSFALDINAERTARVDEAGHWLYVDTLGTGEVSSCESYPGPKAMRYAAFDRRSNGLYVVFEDNTCASVDDWSHAMDIEEVFTPAQHFYDLVSTQQGPAIDSLAQSPDLNVTLERDALNDIWSFRMAYNDDVGTTVECLPALRGTGAHDVARFSPDGNFALLGVDDSRACLFVLHQASTTTAVRQ